MTDKAIDGQMDRGIPVRRDCRDKYMYMYMYTLYT